MNLIQNSLKSLDLPDVTHRPKEQLALTAEKLIDIFRSTDNEYLTMYEIKEAFESKGHNPNVLNA